MLVPKEWLIQNGFEFTHNIKYKGECCYFEPEIRLKSKYDDKSCIYLWLEIINDTEFDVIYIGKAGLGLKTRFNQHSSGFKNSKTGIKNNSSLLPILIEGRKIVVYGRVSELKLFFDRKVSCYSVEEEALIDRFLPWLNRARIDNVNAANSSRARIKNEAQVADGCLANNESRGSIFANSDSVCDFIDSYALNNLSNYEEVINFYQSLASEDRARFTKLLSWTLSLSETNNLDQRIVANYTNQPGGCNGMPVLVFSRLGKSGKSLKHTWRVRLPLGKVGIILPKQFIASNAGNNLVDVNDKSDSFSPIDINKFIDNPIDYTILS